MMLSQSVMQACPAWGTSSCVRWEAPEDLVTALVGSGLAQGNAEAITSYNVLVKACIWHVTCMHTII